MKWSAFDCNLSSRLLLGTASYPSPEILMHCIDKSEAEVITVSLSRQLKSIDQAFWKIVKSSKKLLLPNTAGCRTANDAILMAQMAREIFETNWIKLEVIGDEYNLHPDVSELLIATNELIKQGFCVFPYCTDDLVICKKLLEIGCKVLMPGIAPIGSGQGILNSYNLLILRERFKDAIIIIDAGIGKPSDATALMEMGFDGILLNSAIAKSANPINMAEAFNYAVKAGRLAHLSGIIPKRNVSHPSTPLIDTPFWHQISNK